VLYDPPTESPYSELPDGTIAVKESGTLSASSGAFQLEPGSERAYTGIVLVETGVRGRVVTVAGSGVPGCDVRVQLRERFGRLRSFTAEAATRTDALGQFEIRGLLEGEKRLQLSAPTGNDVAVAGYTISVTSGETTDLGDIPIGAGRDFLLTINLVDSTTGEVCSPEEVFGRESIGANLSVVQRNDERVQQLHCVFRFPVGRPATVYGLLDFPCELSIVPDFDAAPLAGFRISGRILNSTVDPREDRELEVGLPVERTIGPWRLMLTSGDAEGTCDCWVIDAGTGSASRVSDAVATASGNGYETSLSMPAGSYRVYARHRTLNLQAMGGFDIHANAADMLTTLPLAEGVVATGFLPESTGSPRVWQLRGSGLADKPILLQVPVGEGGSYRVTGLPPGKWLGLVQYGPQAETQEVRLPTEAGVLEWNPH